MSLINQVLKDLDQRRAAEYSEAKTDLDDLHFAHTPPAKSKTKPAIIVSVLIISIVAVALAGMYFYNQFNGPDVSSESLSESKHTGATTATDVVVAQTSPNAIKTDPTATVTSSPAVPLTTAKVENKAEQTQQLDVRSRQKKSTAKTKVASQKVVASINTQPGENTSDRNSSKEDAEVISEEHDEEVNATPVKFARSTVPMRAEQKAELAYQNGYDHLKAQRHRQAEQSLRQALAMEPGHIKARELLSGIYIKQGRWIEASELLRNGLTYSPQHLTFSKLYARALMQLNRDAQAIAVLKRYAPSLKSDPNYFAILAALYQRQTQHAQAAEVYARLVTVKPQNGVWWVGLGISLEALGRNQDALQAYGHARKTGNLHKEVARFTNNRLLALEEINFPLE